MAAAAPPSSTAAPMEPPQTTVVPCGSYDIVPCGSYDIVLGTTLLGSSFVARDLLRRTPSTSTFVILTDANVYARYALPLYQQLRALLAEQQGTTTKRVLVHAIPAGEASKSREMKAKIEDEVLLANRCHRDTCVIAVGGGVVGDLAGYVAASYMRGVLFVQVPTTLLACVDSSIGGKTGIDVDAYGKNLLGAFHMPLRVYIDLSVLTTLPRRELVNGMGEVIKAGAIFDAALFELLETTSADSFLALADMPLVQRVVAMAVRVKAVVVTQDTKEMGLRAILNFGHSIGHGIEALVQPEFLHGECVAMGMIKEAEIARNQGLCSAETVGRLHRCLAAYGLPVRVPSHVETAAVLVKMEVDKKNAQGVKKMVLLQEIGTVLSSPYARSVGDDQIALVLEDQIELVPGRVATGQLRVPGSKSISNRVLLLAALGQGTCRIRGLLHSDDTQVMMNALLRVGATFAWEQDGAVLVVEGTGGRLTTKTETTAADADVVADADADTPVEMYLSNAGTAARFLTTAMTLVQPHDGSHSPVVVTGNARMKERPIAPLVDALRANGCELTYLEADGCPPISIARTGLRGGEIPLAGKVSSQYVSSVLLSAPYAQEPVELILQEEHPTSLPYIEMTTQLMAAFGIQVETLAPNHYRIPCGVYQNPPQLSVEVDASSATYPLALAAITGGTVTVEALGNTSLQGDAAFHTVLRDMGCTTMQDAQTTTVTGPSSSSSGLCAVDVDMETMTDAFMTVVALAAVAQGTTRITGIANQRVKECNRIAVMVTELSKLGVPCGELPDGIWITGAAGKAEGEKTATVLSLKDHVKAIEASRRRKQTLIACHNDHRIAMSFAVLGAVVPHVVITDKECTDKTYPAFWDHVSRFLALEVAPVLPSTAESDDADRISVDDGGGQDVNAASAPGVFFVGMRGAGKTSLARAAAEALGLAWLDTDDLLVNELGESIASFVARHDGSWTAFRARQQEVLLRLLADPPRNTIIACGGGVVETSAIVEALAAYPYTVHIHRAIADVLRLLDVEEQKKDHTTTNSTEAIRPSLGEPHASVWTRRLPLYRQSSRFEFVVAEHDHDLPRITRDLVSMLRVIVPHLPSSFVHRTLTTRPDSFFLSLTFPTLDAQAQALLPVVTKNVDAVELRVDLLTCHDDDEAVAVEVARLRASCAPPLPIIFTVRSRAQGGAFPDDQPERMFALLALGVRLGCEFVDVETCWPLPLRRQFVANRARSAIISSFHAVQPSTSMEVTTTTTTTTFISEHALRAVFRECYASGTVQVVKVVIKAESLADALLVTRLADECRASWGPRMPVIALATTEQGKLTRVLNRVLTPVTHARLPAAAAPGQLAVDEIFALRSQLGLLPAREFFLFGSPIGQSPSPDMHNAAFAVHRLPFQYRLHETTDVMALVARMRAPHTAFGGGSVTIPLKVDIMAHVDALSPAARVIGAVNTLVRRDEEGTGRIQWLGDNTDWLGMLRPIARRLQARGSAADQQTALIVGAGGTALAAAYALQQLGVARAFIFNRTFEKAQHVAARFPGFLVALEALTESSLPRAGIVVSTIPASAKFTLPDYLFQAVPEVAPIVLDAAYMPPITPCLEHADARGAVCIQGYEMLVEQAHEQYKRWHTATSALPVDVEVLRTACLARVPEDQRL